MSLAFKLAMTLNAAKARIDAGEPDAERPSGSCAPMDRLVAESDAAEEEAREGGLQA